MKRTLALFGIIIFALLLLPQDLYAQGAAVPQAPPGIDANNMRITGCTMYLGQGKKMPNRVTSPTEVPDSITAQVIINGSIFVKAVFGPPAIDVTFNTHPSKGYELITQQFGGNVGKGSNQYLWAYTDKINNGPAGDSRPSSSDFMDNETFRVLAKNSSSNEWMQSDLTGESGPAIDRPYAKFVKWLNDAQGDGGGCTISSTDATTAANLVSFPRNSADPKKPTMRIDQTGADGQVQSQWYYVAHGNYNEITGYIYRNKANNDNYMVVSTVGKFVAEYDPKTGHLWQPSEKYGWVDGFQAPGETINRITLNVDVDLADVLKKVSKDILNNGDNATIETQLDSATGPFTNKIQGGYAQDFTHFQAEIKDQIFIVSKEDLDKPDFRYADSAEHLNHLIKKVVVCMHRGVNADAKGPPFMVGEKDLQVRNATSGLFDAPDLNKTGSGDNIQWATLANTRLTFKADVSQTQTCGTNDDVSPFQQIASQVPKAGNLILNAIRDALNAIASLIQQAIINFLAWIIGLVSHNVPI